MSATLGKEYRHEPYRQACSRSIQCIVLRGQFINTIGYKLTISPTAVGLPITK